MSSRDPWTDIVLELLRNAELVDGLADADLRTLIGRLRGQLRRRLARMTLVSLDLDDVEAATPVLRELAVATARYARRAVVVDMTDRIAPTGARALPSLAQIAARLDGADEVTARMADDTGLWALSAGDQPHSVSAILAVMQRLARDAEHVLVLASRADAESLGEADPSCFSRFLFVEATSSTRGAPAEPAERHDDRCVLLLHAAGPRTRGEMRDADRRRRGKTYGGRAAGDACRGVAALARELTGARVGVALGAGASRGFAHIGALERLRERGVPIDALAGSSSGAGIGSLWSFGYEPSRIAALFGELQAHAVRWTLPYRSLLSGSSLERHLQRAAAGNRFDDARWPFGVVAVDLYSAREELFDEGDLPRVVLASCAIPGVYPPVKLGDRWYVDGGLLHPVPTAPARKLGADVVIGVDLSSQEDDDRDKVPAGGPHLFDVLRLSANIMHARLTEHSRAGADVLLRPTGAGERPGVGDYDKARGWIAHGRRAVDERWDDIRAANPWLDRAVVPSATVWTA